MIKINTVTVFCGSADGLNPEFYQSAYNLGEFLAARGIAIATGGGKTGLMGAIADGALNAKGQVIGVINESLNTSRLAHAGLTRMEVFPDIQLRKAEMLAMADAFIALPGGYGTFDELFEMLTWAQIGLLSKPLGLLNTRHYFDPLIAMVENAIHEGFIYPEHRGLFVDALDAESLFEKLNAWQPPENLQRWLERPE